MFDMRAVMTLMTLEDNDEQAHTALVVAGSYHVPDNDDKGIMRMTGSDRKDNKGAHGMVLVMF
jgi:hypothetical protein